jgi:hypothetical protein
MMTDPLPHGRGERHEYEHSDQLLDLPLPDAALVQARTKELIDALAGEVAGPVRIAAGSLAEDLARHYRVAVPTVRVLGVRPHRVRDGVCSYQLYGDYMPSTHRIRVWMRTAIRRRVSSPKSFVATLLHEFCHHLDCTALAHPNTFHTRGFYTRIDQLYHLALGTAPSERRPLRWTKRGSVWALDWAKSRARAPAT